MQRRAFLEKSLALSLAASPLAQLLAKGYRPANDGALHMIRGNVGYYTNKGGTIGLYLPGSFPEGGVMIDTQFPNAAKDALAVLQQHGKLTRLGIIINTHHHADHTSGNPLVLPLADQSVIHEQAMANLRRSLAQENKNAEPYIPQTTFNSKWSTNLLNGKEAVSVTHFGPAHTNGDAVVHFQNADVAHLGDLVFNRRFPYIDPAGGGDILNWAEVLREIRKYYGRNTIYIFGHSADSFPVFGTMSDLQAFENYLRRLRVYVRRNLRRGIPLEQLKKKTLTIPGAREWTFGDKQRDLNLDVMYAALENDR